MWKKTQILHDKWNSWYMGMNSQLHLTPTPTPEDEAALQDAQGYPYDDGQVYSTTCGWVRQSECLSSKQNNRVHFGMCTKHTNGLCRMPSYPRPHKRGDSKFNKMTHMTENIYCYMHSDTQTNNPKEIAHKQFTPVVMAKWILMYTLTVAIKLEGFFRS